MKQANEGLYQERYADPPKPDFMRLQAEEEHKMPNNDAIKQALAEAKSKANVVASQTDTDFGALIGTLDTLDWRKLPPPLMAQILCRKPYRGKRNEPDYYLRPDQALFFALRCYELGISPLGNEAFFDARGWTVGVTLEGQKHIIRNLGIIAGPPNYKRLERQWPARTPRPPDLAEVVEGPNGKPVMRPIQTDIGYECSVEVNVKEKWMTCTYTAWLSEVYKPTPEWNTGTENMLQVRSLDRCLGLITGTGPSSPVVGEGSEPPTVMPSQPTIDLKPLPVVSIVQGDTE